MYKQCRDVACSTVYKTEIKDYQKGQQIKSTKQYFLEKPNKAHQEEVTIFFYHKGMLASSVTNHHYLSNAEKTLEKTILSTYSHGKVVSVKKNYSNDQHYEDKVSLIEYQYDKEGKLISSTYTGWDNDNNIAQLRLEEFEYHKNQYTYRYVESLKTEGGKKKLPLQYELTYLFH